MLPTHLHSYLLWRGSVNPDAQTLASRRFTATVSLFPAGMVGIFVFGWYAGLVVLASVVSAILTDTVFHRFIYKQSTGSRDGTWLLTGVLIGLMLPPNVPIWLPCVGAALAVYLGKYIFAVDSMPLIQPATLGLFLLFVLTLPFANNPVLGTHKGHPRWPVLARDIEPSTAPDKVVWEFLGGDVRKSVSRREWREANFSGRVAMSEHGEPANAVHAPRPIDKIKEDPGRYVGAQTDPAATDPDTGETYNWLRMILGYIPATIGGSSSLALILGVLLLVFTGANSWVTPVFALGTMFSALHMLAWIFSGSANPPVIADNISIHLLTGSTLIGAFYLLADSTTVPRSFTGKVYAGVLFGVLEVLIRIFTPLAEGVVVSALCVQMLSFVIDQWLAPPVEETRTTTISVNLSPSTLGRL